MTVVSSATVCSWLSWQRGAHPNNSMLPCTVLWFASWCDMWCSVVHPSQVERSISTCNFADVPGNRGRTNVRLCVKYRAWLRYCRTSVPGLHGCHRCHTRVVSNMRNNATATIHCHGSGCTCVVSSTLNTATVTIHIRRSELLPTRQQTRTPPSAHVHSCGPLSSATAVSSCCLPYCTRNHHQ